MDEPTTEDLSAFLDDELGTADRERVESILATSAAARAELDRLAYARDQVRAGAEHLSAAESAALDAEVLGTRPLGAVAGVHTPPARRNRTSPRKRGRPSWPYFAAAASIAVVLSLGIVVLAQLVGRDTRTDSAAPPRSEAPTNTGPRTEALDVRPDPGAQPRQGAAPPQPEPAPYVAPAPELYLSGVAVADAAGLGRLVQPGPAPSWSRVEGIADLADLGAGAGIDRAELEACLGAAGPGVPVRVDVGTYAGTAAFIVVLADPATSARTAVAVSRGVCTPLAASQPPP